MDVGTFLFGEAVGSVITAVCTVLLLRAFGWRPPKRVRHGR